MFTLLFLVFTNAAYVASDSVDTYMEACDGSAAVPIGTTAFIAASDEDNILRVYKYGTSKPIKEFNLDGFLELKSGSKEVDIEGAARIGNRIYWIGSHSRDKKGNKQSNRARLFATDVTINGEDIQIIPVGVAYKDLRKDLVSADALRAYKLGEAAKLPPHKPGGFNIEGLATTPEGDLLIGFRNPVPRNMALIVPLKNPNKIMRGKRAKLGQPILLSLGGLGIRSVEYSSVTNKYFILAGSSEGDQADSPFRLYEWPGPGSTDVSLIRELTIDDRRIQPEAIFTYAKTNDVYVLSDDGEFKANLSGSRCKDLPTLERSFHGFLASTAITPK
jgi:hypothetical protein